MHGTEDECWSLTLAGLNGVETPFLSVDLDLLEANIHSLSQAIMGRAGVNWRPHIKAIRSPILARKLIDAGAVGVTCARISEAEAMASAGITSILIAHQTVTDSKIDRLVELNRKATAITSIDNLQNLHALSAAASKAGIVLPVVVEVNIGLDRSGVEPGEPTLRLARAASSASAIRFLGLMGWEGHAAAIVEPELKQKEIARSIKLLVSSAALCRSEGIAVELVSCGGSGTYLHTAFEAGVTEVQAGGAVFSDVRCRDVLGVPTSCALSVWATVVSRPSALRIICDAGWKALASFPTPPEPRGIDGLSGLHFSAEHVVLELAVPSETPQVGERIEFTVGYSDSTVFLHKKLFGIRKCKIETVFPIVFS